MSEHHTQGRQGQGSRRRHYKNQYNRHPRRPRVPREKAPEPKPSLLQRVLRFFGFGRKKEELVTDQRNTRTPRQGQRNERGTNPSNREPRQANAKGNVRQRIPSTPPTRNARLHVGNLSYEATESELEELFKGFGAVRSVTVIYNRRTYKSKGYAFVEMRYIEDACKAAEVLHGQPFMGRELMVSAADEKHDEREAEQLNAQEYTLKKAGEEAPVEAPVEQAVEAPAETPAEAPVAPVETPSEAPVETPSEAPVEAPAETSTEAPAEDKAPAQA